MLFGKNLIVLEWMLNFFQVGMIIYLFMQKTSNLPYGIELMQNYLSITIK